MKPLDDKQIQTDEAAPDKAAEKRDNSKLMLKLLRSLSENQQEVIRLKFQNDLSYAEISRITGLSVSNVGYLIHMGIKAIREQIGADKAPSIAIKRRAQ